VHASAENGSREGTSPRIDGMSCFNDRFACCRGVDPPRLSSRCNATPHALLASGRLGFRRRAKQRKRKRKRKRKERKERKARGNRSFSRESRIPQHLRRARARTRRPSRAFLRSQKRHPGEVPCTLALHLACTHNREKRRKQRTCHGPPLPLCHPHPTPRRPDFTPVCRSATDV